ncbi:MAG: glycerol-3-phosphate dehydrogenase/oxidase [Verrucomicrobia bacterium]|nr:glycerol-3-phosphate dehydrogenase/oxidase [Verrucomicrobiota bacterium]
MDRVNLLEYCKRSPDLWDILIIGGGATGLGAAVDAASRGFKTLLLEQSDFAKGTSSRSTKLIHGGLRYLKQGNIALVTEALKERGLLCQNAPHLVSHLPFLVPNYHWWEAPFYGIGLKVYDLLAGDLGLEKSTHLSREETLRKIPTLEAKDLRGGVVYYDGQFDDARLAIALAQTCEDSGGVPINYMPVHSLLKENGKVTGVRARDLENGQEYDLHAKVVINATGVFSDGVRKMDDPKAQKIVAPSQGVHLVLDRSFMPTDMAIMIPHTDDGRVLFFVPWHRHIIVGTTDTPIRDASLEPRPLQEEIDFLLQYAGRYLTRQPTRTDILSVFAGLRPLVQAKGIHKTSSLSRDHTILVSDSGLITIVGGKWTTYRKMAQDVIDKAIAISDLDETPCSTQTLRLHGYKEGPRHPVDSWACYGSDSAELEKLIAQHPDWGHLLHPRLPYLPVEVVWAVRHEMARTLEDVLARRTRSLLLDAKASLEIAPRVAHLMAQELGRSSDWEQEQLIAYKRLAQGYL